MKIETYLFDVNFLIALFDPSHLHHERAHEFRTSIMKDKWATCPLTENGFIRILSSPAYKNIDAMPADLILILNQFKKQYAEQYLFLSDKISITDQNLFKFKNLAGPGQITDVYLLALAIINNAKLLTFDNRIATPAIKGNVQDSLIVVEY